MTESLADLNDAVVRGIEKLPAADPLRLAGQDEVEGERRVRQIIADVCPEGLNRIRLVNEYFGAGPIEDLLEDPDVSEIILNGQNDLWFEKAGRLEKWNESFLSSLTFRNFISRLSREANIQASLDCPFADGHWRGCRVHLIIPPASGTHAVVTLRKHAMTPWTFARLEAGGWASPESINAIRDLVLRKRNFLVVGGTGSGKTSVLNACLTDLGDRERTLIIEDTSELNIPNTVSSKLLTRRDPQRQLRDIDQGELLKQALRMRPDRLVMGEIRGGEAKDLLMAFATGHTGCMGTLHAESARQALIRLEMLIQIGAPQWNLQAVRTLIFLSLQYVVVVGKRSDGQRALEGLYRISSLEEIGFLIEKVI